MKKFILLTFAVLLIVTGTILILRFGKQLLLGFGALQITSNVKSKAYVNDTFIGDTPLCKCQNNNMLREGEYSLKIVPEDKTITPFTYKVKINKGVLTAVDRVFVPGNYSSAYILTLEKNNKKEPELLITSLPEGALVSIDNTPAQGITPFLLKNVSESEHDIEISKEGYNKKSMRIKTVPYYKLVADIILGSADSSTAAVQISPTPTPLATTTASPSTAKPTPTPLAKKYYITVLATPNGFLRVRETPSLSAQEVARIKTGDSYAFLDEQKGWYKIELTDGKTGWVSSSYSKKTTTE